jgi:hypothetical protein
MAIEVYAKDSTDNSKSYYTIFNVLTCVKVIDGHWGLIEFPLTVPVANAPVQITVWNKEMKKDALFELDELMVRPVDVDFYLLKGDTIIRNTRVYYPQR